MNFEAVMISSGQPLLIRIFHEVSDRMASPSDRGRYFDPTAGLPWLKSQQSGDRPDGLFSTLPSYPSLIRRICQGLHELFSVDDSKLRPDPAEGFSRFGPRVTATEEALPIRLYKAARFAISQIDERSEYKGDFRTLERAYAELPFLVAPAAAPFPIRLAREAAEAARTFASDPGAFIRGLAAGGEDPVERHTRVGAGLAVALLVYAVALLIAYGSYCISHRYLSSAESSSQIKVTLLALPAMTTTKPLPRVKQAGGGNDRLTLPKRLIDQPKPEVIKPSLEPRPLDQIQAKPATPAEPARVAPDSAGTSSITTAAVSGGSGTGGGAGTGQGTGIGSGRGPGLSTEESVNYNGVFSLASVTVRPQLLGRPTPGYTEEARRNQIEGSVKVSVLLRADGAVSDVLVLRGLGYGLDEAAIAAARQLRFVPGQKDGRAVNVRLFLEFKFSLL